MDDDRLLRVCSIAAVLADRRRVDLLARVIDQPRCSSELAEACGLSAQNTSKHLVRLRRAGLVRVVRDGRRSRYEAAGDVPGRLLTSLSEVRVDAA